MQNSLIKIISADTFTPFSLARKLHAKVILESASYQKGRSRYSLLMIDEAFTVIQEGAQIYIHFPPPEQKRKRVKYTAHDILDVLKYFADQHRAMHQDFPFPAGGIGFCSFEFARFCDKIKMPDKPDELGLPDAAFMFGHSFVVFDHYTDQLYLIALNYRERSVDLEQVIANLERRISDLNFNYLQADEARYNVQETSAPGHEERYMEMVNTVKQEIVAGNLLQAVPSRRRRFKTDMPAITAYRILRQSNPAPYMFYLDFDAYQLFGVSPEVHLRVREGEAMIRPIAGTRRRGRGGGRMLRWSASCLPMRRSAPST